MAHQVFLSYATEDADSVRLLCRVLEAEEGIRCWIAPRDVPAGTDYAASILDGIKNAELVLLLFSAATNISPYVLREIERAVAYERPVISVRLDTATPNASLEYYLNMLQWLDAPRGIESKRREIVAAVRKQLEGGKTGLANLSPAAAARTASTLPAASAPPPTPTDARSHEGERKLVTVLVAGVSDFAGLSQRLDPEALHDLVTECFERLVPAVERYGGTVNKVSDENVMGLFGAPKAHEDDPERALHAAIEMRQALTYFNKGRSLPVPVHFGVNTGMVYAGGVGAGACRDYSVMGEAVSAASTLKDRAKPGEILVGPDTHRHAEPLFIWEAAGRTRAKSGLLPIVAYRLLEARPRSTTESAHPSRGLSSPLVGRERELTSLLDRLAWLREGQGAVILVSGEAGLGKSRLVAEAQVRAEKDGISWLEGHALSFGRAISYWPLLEIIQQDAGIETDDPESERWAKLAARVGTLFGEERGEILPYLATLLNLALPEEFARKTRYLDGEAMGRQVYRATRLYFARLAQRRPTVVVFEDIHWLDGSTALLLEHLLPLVNDVRILFCLVSRPETETAYTRLRELLHAEYEGRLTDIALEPLSPDDSGVLIRNLARLEELPPRLKDTITERAEGNPFYVEEVVRSLIDQGGLVPDAATGRYRVTDKAAHIPIPDTLHGVIMARIDRLDDDLKQVLRLASVAGRSFFYRVLASVGEAERELDQSLTDLETRELIREKARIPELEYVFKHALVQEATYESILLQRRKELHRKVALATETIFPDRLEEFFSLLAYHYSKAEDWEKAQDYLFKAGDQAGKIAADTEALAHYEEAIDAYARAFGDKWDPLQRAVLERKMGEALYRRGDHQQAREYLYRALATLGHPFPEAPGAVRRALLAELMRQVRHRVIPRSGRRMSTLSARRLAEERCALHRVLGVIEQYADFSKAGLHSFLALNVAEDAHLDATVFLMSVYIGVICGIIGLPRLGVPYLNRALPGAERLGEPSVLGHVQWFAATYYLWVDDDWERAYELTKSACGVLSAAGDVREWASAMCMRVHPLVEWGRLAEGLDLAREVTRVGRESGDLYTEAWGVAWEGEVQYMMGSLEEGEQKMQVALAALLARSDFRIGAKVAGHLAHCLLDEGKLDEALPLLLENQARARKYGLIGGTLHYANTGLAAARLLAAEHAEPQDKGAALDEARAACKNLLKSCKVDSTGLVPAHRMQGTYEWLRGRSSNAEKCWRKSLEHADKLGARYEGALSMLEIGRRLAHREQLERAASEFETMGCQFFLAEARRLLGLPEVAEQAVVA